MKTNPWILRVKIFWNNLLGNEFITEDLNNELFDYSVNKKDVTKRNRLLKKTGLDKSGYYHLHFHLSPRNAVRLLKVKTDLAQYMPFIHKVLDDVIDSGGDFRYPTFKAVFADRKNRKQVVDKAIVLRDYFKHMNWTHIDRANIAFMDFIDELTADERRFALDYCKIWGELNNKDNKSG